MDFEPKITVEEYLAALRENRLMGIKCSSCGFVTAPPRLACRRCSGMEGKVVQLSGRGKIATYTSVHIAVQNRRDRAPYLVVMVEMDEGPWVMGNLNGVDPCKVGLDLIGKRVVMKNNLPPSGEEKQEDIAPQFELEESN